MKWALAAAGVVVLGLLGCQQRPPAEVYGRLPDFVLTDQTGAAFSSRDLAGRVALLDFIYTHCTEACPVLSSTFAQAQRKLADDNLLRSRVMLLSVSVDPEHDTPAALAEYGQNFKADAQGWKLLTGDWDQVFDVVTGLKLATRPPRPSVGAPPPGGAELTHTTRVVLIDGQGQVRGYLDGLDSSADSLVAAARRVAQ
ncbi:MAG: SCO family protein [Chloroflexota bacterium]|nr:SCO family protein [Chloroflexota bacterium]